MSDSPSLPHPDSLEISVHDARGHLHDPRQESNSPKVHWVDCREQDEHQICRIEGAKLLPLSNFVAIMDQALPEDKNRPVIVYCHHGMRSMRATRFLRQKGYPNTWSMSGGIDLWSREIDADVPRY